MDYAEKIRQKNNQRRDISIKAHSKAVGTKNAMPKVHPRPIRTIDGANLPVQCCDPYVLYNKQHKSSLPVPKGKGPNGGLLQSHHGLQQQWAKANLSQYGYDSKLAPTITIETGSGMPHSIISGLQNARRNERVRAGKGKWSSSLQQELSHIPSDFRTAGFSDSVIDRVLEQQYEMLEKLGVQHERIEYEKRK